MSTSRDPSGVCVRLESLVSCVTSLVTGVQRVVVQLCVVVMVHVFQREVSMGTPAFVTR